MPSPSWHYSGDIDLCYGGFYWRLPSPDFDDYVEAVEVTPGDPAYWIVKDIIFMPAEKYATALETCGYKLGADGIIDPLGHENHGFDRLKLLVESFYAYWGLNSHQPTYRVVIGGPRKHPFDRRLAHNADLRRFVEREFL